MMHEIRVRRLGLRDVPAYERFVKTGLDEDVTAFRHNIDWWRKATQKDLERLLNTRFTIGALEGQSVVGTGALCVALDNGEDDPPWEAELTNIHVLLSHRRRGIGRRIVAALIEEAERAAYIDRLALRVDYQNKGAMDLYSKAGFCPEEPRTEKEPGVLRMQRRLCSN